MHEQSIQEHVQANLTAAIDQSHEYDQFSSMVAEHFAELFNAHFKTDFIF
jgi:hypothetical protein